MDIKKFSGVLIERGGKILLVQERHIEARGLWSFPLGHVEKNETLRAAAEREAGEETDFRVKILKEMGIKIIPAREFKSSHRFSTGKIKLTIFYGKLTRKKYGMAELRRRWFTKKAIGKTKLRGSWMMKFL